VSARSAHDVSFSWRVVGLRGLGRLRAGEEARALSSEGVRGTKGGVGAERLMEVVGLSSP
jgi:hypothetical protein